LYFWTTTFQQEKNSFDGLKLKEAEG